MKTSPISSRVKAGAALAFIITALIGWKLGDAQAKAPAAEAAAPDRADRPVRRMRGATGPSDVAAQRMAAIRAGRDEGERMRATIARPACPRFCMAPVPGIHPTRTLTDRMSA